MNDEHVVKPPLNNVATFSLVVILLAIHVALAAWLAAHQSPNIDEPAHLAAGMAVWQYGSFDLYCVNPPLMRAVATLPILFMPHEEYWGDFNGAPQPRPEFVLGEQFIESHPDRWERFLITARLAILPFTILGGLFCYLWAAELFGRKAGLMALALWCFSPNILTWSSLICTDGVAAALGVGAGYFFWRCLKQPTWGRVVLAGLFVGLAQLSKMTWIVLFGVWPLLWLLVRQLSVRQGSGKTNLVKLAVILLIGLYVLNLGYAFDGSFTLLGDFTFTSQLFGGASAQTSDGSGANRFAHSILRWLPVPLPKPYLRGMDLQRLDFEQGMPSYLFGEWSDRGWWYYYLVGLALKVPLGTWGLVLLTAAGSCYSWFRRKQIVIGQSVVLAPALAVLILVSSQDGFSGHFRYVLPVLPFAFVWVSPSANLVAKDKLASSLLVLGLLGWSVISSMATFPHTISYFNELVGGPANGHHYMLGSSFSWSQDNFYLRQWLRVHPNVHSPYMLLDRTISLERLGISSRGAPPPSNCMREDKSALDASMLGPVPGWHIISLQNIHQRDGGYLYFLQFKPFATIGYSTYIYKIDVEDANRVRCTLGLPELLQEQTSPERWLDDMVAARSSLSKLIKVALFAASDLDLQSELPMRKAINNVKDFSLSILSEHDIRERGLDEFDVLVVPGGQAGIQGSALGSKGRKAIQDFVRRGGGYVGVCAGAFLAVTNQEWSLKLVNARAIIGERYVPNHGKVPASFRGWGAVSVELTDAGHRLFDTPLGPFQLDYTGGPVFSCANEANLPDYVPLAYFRSEVWEYPFQKGTMIHTPAIIAAPFGQGRVILFSPHPDTSDGYQHLLTRAIRGCARRTAAD